MACQVAVFRGAEENLRSISFADESMKKDHYLSVGLGFSSTEVD